MPTYDFNAIEKRWQQHWESKKTFRTLDPGEPGTEGKPKYYILDMFPYPSGSGLHVGHPEGYTATDILARFKRMNGFHVLHPMGWDAFGLPAEQHAIQTGEHPSLNTQQNIDNFRRQIKSLGFSYDWDREVDTTDPNYYRWTQWIFLTLFDTWYDPVAKKGRPIAELPIPAEVKIRGEAFIREHIDGHRLAYESEVPVNWCEALGTVLSNEEVIDGKSERGNHPVVRRPLKQWLMRITAYAERLIDDLQPLDWTESIKQMQRNWIGRSAGAEVKFQVPSSKKQVANSEVMEPGTWNLELSVFTTRPDTLFGATYLVLSPEHELVAKITTPEQKSAVVAYQQQASRKSDFERTEMAKAKTGVFTGAFAINPVNQKQIPIWIADYVLGGYGTGAIMAVPAHDERDFEFAKQFDLPIVTVVTPNEKWLKETGSSIDDLKSAYTDDGVAMNSGMLDGLTTEEAKQKITAWLIAEGKGEAKVNYKLRDWLFSRQRYWGEPFPILHELDANGKRTGVMIPESELPLKLPELADFKPTGTPDGPLSKATDWLTVHKNGKTYRRETNTMPQWAGSCWYYLRYIDPNNAQAFAESGKLNHWLPVDLYVGGAEHAVLHLLYSRFWHKVLFDRGYVNCVEPFHKLVNQGMILGEVRYVPTSESISSGSKMLNAVMNPNPNFMNASPFDGFNETEVVYRDSKYFWTGDHKIQVVPKADKMSKSRGNVINPDDVVRGFGADSLRLFEMFMGPLEAVKPWSTKGVEGVYRFLGRVWRLFIDDNADTLKLNPAIQDVAPDRDALRMLHRTIQRVTDETARLSFNTAIAAMMEFVNHFTPLTVRSLSALKLFVLLLAPYAPHIAEELWAVLGHTDTLAYEPWPSFDPEFIKLDSIEIPVQVNGKLKVKLNLPPSISKDELEAAALNDPKVMEALAGKAPKKVIVVPGKLVNIVL